MISKSSITEIEIWASPMGAGSEWHLLSMGRVKLFGILYYDVISEAYVYRMTQELRIRD